MSSQSTLAQCFRFSLRQLLIATTVVAIGCYALRYASPWWTSKLFYCSLLLLATAALLAINTRGVSRAFWLAFLVLGAGHLLILGWVSLPNAPGRPGTSFVTHWLSREAYERLRPALEVQPVMYPDAQSWGKASFRHPGPDFDPKSITRLFTVKEDGVFRGFGPGPFYVEKEHFVGVAIHLWTMIVALAGGLFSRALFILARQRRKPSNATLS